MPAEGWSELHEAAHKGDASKVLGLLQGGPGASDAKGDTPLHAAAHQGHTPVVRLLLDAGAFVDLKNDAGDTALIAAADGGHEETVSALIAAGASPEAVTATGASALFFAALRGHAEVARRLVRAVPGLVHTVDQDGLTPLWAASWKGHAAVAELILAEAAAAPAGIGFDVSHKVSRRLSPLAVASKLGHEAAVKVLLRSLLDAPGAMDQQRAFAVEESVMLAAGQGHQGVVRQLLAALGGPPGPDALAAAISGGHAGTLDILLGALGPVRTGDMADCAGDSLLTLAAHCGELDCVKALVAAGCSPGSSAGPQMLFPSGRLPLCQAAAEGHMEIVNLLLDLGSDPAAVEAGNHTSLYLAASAGHTAVVERLIDAGAPVDEATETGVTAICAAAREGHSQCCRLLLDAGADPFGEGLHAPSALEYCASHAHPDALEVLLQAHMLTDVTTGQLLHFGLSRPLVSASVRGHEDVCHHLLELISEEELSEALSLAAQCPDHDAGDHPLHTTVASWVASRRHDLSALQQGIPHALAAAVGSVRRERDAAVRENKRLRSMIGPRKR